MALIEIRLTQHAVDRFQFRVRPGLSTAAAEVELARLAAMGDIVTDAPAWHACRQRRTASAYLVVGDLVLPLEPVCGNPDALVAVTASHVVGSPNEARARRNERRRRERRQRTRSVVR